MMDSVNTDEARAALAAAIAERDAAGNRLEAARGAVERVSDLLAAALVKQQAAQAEVVELHESAPQRILEMASTGVLTMDRPLKAAKAAETDACEDVEEIRRTLTTCKTAIAEAERALMYAQMKVDNAAKPILAAEAVRVLVEAEALKVKFDKMRATLAFLGGALPAGSPLVLRFDNALEATPARNLAPPPDWVAWRGALLRDAAAPLPAQA
jgi:hypothetical protein